MFSKMHLELNPIDSYYSAMKVFLWQHCDYILKVQRQHLTAAATRFSIASIRRYYQHVRLFGEIYFQDALDSALMPFKL